MNELKDKDLKSIMLPNACNKFNEYMVLPSVVKLKKQRIYRLPSQDDLWKAIKANYLFLMDNNLINECQKTKQEFSLYSPPPSPPHVKPRQTISFPEFVERFNDLHDKLHALQKGLDDGERLQNSADLQYEMDLLEGEFQYIQDQALVLQRLDPNLKDDVSRRSTILKNKWELLTDGFRQNDQELDQTTQSLGVEIRNIRKWLREVEERLRRLKVNDDSTLDDMKNIFNKEKVLQREIEERGKEINFLVRRCAPLTTDGATAVPTRLRRYALHLERSLHHIWIRSLEKQCLTEQLLHRHAAVTAQNLKDPSDVDSDEGPLRKHRRLTLDCRTAVSATMDRLRKDSPTRNDVMKNALKTRDVGVLCCERVPVNDKCIMVGTTGIDALKAKYGDDFTNFEIIQDVGYSSESSTHLSGDDTGTDHFNVRIYKFSEDNQPLNLKDELEAAAGLRDFYCLGSSVESSSSVAVSLNDSGLGVGDTPAVGDSGDLIDQFRVDDEYEQESLDYLKTVLDECVDFGANVVSEPEEMHFNISGIESDDPSENFHNRSSFTTSAQVFYKMISVDSDNGEGESPTNENNISSITITETSTTETTPEHKSISRTTFENHGNTKFDSESDPETFKPVRVPNSFQNWSDRPPKPFPKRLICSTPMCSSEDKQFASSRQQGVKRKRNQDVVDAARFSSRIQSWLKRQDIASPVRQQLFKSGDISSCDASCECTSSSADEGNVFSSTSTFFEDDVLKHKLRVDSCSAEGSVETVLHALLDSDVTLLPPPPSSSTSCYSGSKNCRSTCCRLAEVRGHGKLSSDSNLNRRRRNRKEIIMSSSRRTLQKHNHDILASHCRHRQYSSLPSILRHPSDSSTDDNCIPSMQVLHSDTKATDSVNRSSSSEKGGRRRRSRKKSSSSNRSSASVLLSGGDSSRHRSRTLQSSASSCGSRRRHRSQRSELFCAEEVFSDEEEIPLKVDIPPVEEQSVRFEDLGCSSSVLLSPTESDIVLTQLEEQSIVSDQVWDGYQEMPYLSEGYSEATVDEDAIRKLTEFGDDYGSAIGQPSRLLDSAVSNKNIKIECKKSSKCAPAAPRLSSVDSDSDTEDFHYFIEEAGKALNFSRTTLKRREDGETFTSADYAELLATCGEHLRCLQTICEHINIDTKKHSFSSADVSQMHSLIEKWQDLKKDIEMLQESDDPSWQKYKDAQQNIEAMFSKMSQITSSSYVDMKSVASWEDVQKNFTRLQMVLMDLQDAKEQLLAVNLQVHHFTTQYCHDDLYNESTLKSDVTELYRQWNDAYEQNRFQLTELEALKRDWEAYDDDLRKLRVRIKEVEWNSEDNCDNIKQLENSVTLRQDLDRLELRAFALESRLSDGEAWKDIDVELKDLKRRIGRHGHLNSSTYLSANHRSPSIVVEEDADDNFEDAIQQLCDDDCSDLTNPDNKAAMSESTPKSPKKHRKNRFWRIVRMAVPVQLALVLLYCLACYMEPSCCNMLNNFNFSFTPQLRYFEGHPPV